MCPIQTILIILISIELVQLGSPNSENWTPNWSHTSQIMAMMLLGWVNDFIQQIV